MHQRPRGPEGTQPGPAHPPGRGDPRPADRDDHQDQRPPRPEPRRGRAHDRDPPGLRLAQGQDRLRHRAPGLRAQAADRPGRAVRHAAAARRADRLPEPGRVRARPGGELARLDQPVLRRRPGQGVQAARRAGPDRGRGHRRRRADRRDGLGGAEQHRRRQGLAAGHDRQRQRLVVPADDRRPGRAPGRDPGQPAVRARARLHQDHAVPDPAGRPAAVRDAAPRQEGHQGRHSAAGDVRGPGPEVRRPHRRARRAAGGDTRCGAPVTSAAPVLVHVITKKGFGYPEAEQNTVDCLHQVPAAGAVPGTWSRVFGDEMVAIGARRPDVVAITAAMLYPTGLAQFAAAYPDRVYDVGIAEQHAMTSAAGLAMAACTRWWPSTRRS